MTDQMTNRNKHIQPAPRPFNLLVRGGRLTRFKGQVASIAPGFSVVALAVAAALFSGGAAQAADECGAEDKADPNDTITCAAGNYAEGITYTGSDGLTLRLDDADIEVGGSGVSVEGTGEGNVSVQIGNGKVGTSSDDAYGLYVRATGNGDATVQMNGGTVTMEGGIGFDQAARALRAWVDNTASEATATVSMTGGGVDTSGDFSSGLWAWTNGTGEAIAQMDGGTITTGGREAHGIWAITGDRNERTESEGAMATALMTAGDVTTKGVNAYGIVASAHTSGAATARMEGGTVTTKGVGSHGLFAWIYNRRQSGAALTAHMTGGEIKTDGDGAHGISALTIGSGVATAQITGETLTKVTTLGANAHGLNAYSESGQAVVNLGVNAIVKVSGAGAHGIRATGTTGFDVDVAGSVTGGSGSGAAIRAESSSDIAEENQKETTIEIFRGSTVTAGKSGLAIWVEGRGAEITSEGDITGDIVLGAGNNILELKGGRFTGDIYGGAGDDTVTISAATEYDGSYILDGGVGANDRLTLNGQNISTTAGHLRNWSEIALNKTELTLAWVTTVDMDLSIDAGSVFRAFGGNGGMTIAGDKVTNEGDVVFSVQDGVAGDVIRIEGNYTGSDTGSDVFALDARMDGTDTDRLHFTGDVSGDMELLIASVGGAGAEGASLVIDVVTVGGTSDGTFTLMEGNHVTSDGEHAVIAGAYLYTLAETDRGWALSALSETGETNYQPSAPIYDSYGQSLLALNGLTSLRNRGSSEDFRILAWEGGTGDQDSGSPLWLQMGADRITLSEENSTTGAALESTVWEMEVGADIVVIESGAGLLVGGLMGSYAMGSASVSSAFGDGSIDTTGLGVGVATTWYDTRRFYVDGQFTFTSYSSDLSSAGLGALTEENSGTGFAVSLEAGQQLDLGSRLTVIPQAQLSVSSVAFDDFAGDAHGEQVTLEGASSQQLRLGLEFGLQEQEARRFYGIANLFYEFGAGSEVNVTGSALTTESEPWAAGVGLGGTYMWSDRVDFFGETSYTTGLGNVGDTSALSVNAGLKVVF